MKKKEHFRDSDRSPKSILTDTRGRVTVAISNSSIPWETLQPYAPWIWLKRGTPGAEKGAVYSPELGTGRQPWNLGVH